MTVLALFPCYFWRLLVIPDEDFAEIVHGLLHKTNTEKVAWELTKAGDFRLELPHSIIRMRYHHPLGDPYMFK